MPLFFSSLTLIAGLVHGVNQVTPWPCATGIRSSRHRAANQRAKAHEPASIKRSSEPGLAHAGCLRLAACRGFFATEEPRAACVRRGVAALFVMLVVFSLTLGFYQTAQASPGFSGLDRDTLETLKRSDQRGKHPALPAQPDEREPHRRHEPSLSSSQAAEIARQREGGRVLNVVLEHDSGEPYYRVKILERGRVQVVHIDAR